MKDRIVPQEEIDNGYIAFCKDLGADGETRQEIEKYLKVNNIVVEQKEDKNLIWFEQIENEQVKFYSVPIMKYIQEFDKETRFMMAADNPIGHLCLYESMLPIYNFNKKRKGKIPPVEVKREERKDYIDKYQRHIDWAYDRSVFGYILFNGRGIRYPRTYSDIKLIYEGGDEKDISNYSDTELLKEILSNKERYAWYELGDEWFIVRNSKKKEYQYLADVENQEIKLVKIKDNKIIIEDIVKDDLTLRVEKEIDKCLQLSEGVIGRYIRYTGRCFEVVKREEIPVEVEDDEFSLFPKRDYRLQCSYEKVDTNLTYDEISKVVKEGNKYKWFSHHGKLYIAWTFGTSEMPIIVGDFIPDTTEGVDCEFKYKNSPNETMLKFIENGVWDGDAILEKYECSQENIDNLVRELIYYKILEKNEDGSNKYKIIEHHEDLVLMIHCLEHELHL